MTYAILKPTEPDPIDDNQVVLVASGDLRLSANQTCWLAQEEMERRVISSFEKAGVSVSRGHSFDPSVGHGFISSQRMGMDVFTTIPREAPLVVAEAVWQYSHHVLAGLLAHQGPILTIANWEGEWPGLVGMLNLNASLTKAGRDYSTLWSKSFDDEYYISRLQQWFTEWHIDHDTSHVKPLDPDNIPASESELGQALARQLVHRKAILGVFDEGCMGMYNAIIDDNMLMPMGIFKERLSQSALLAEMRHVPLDVVHATFSWLEDRGMTFAFGEDPETELTIDQVHDQIRMYVAAARIADRFGCDAIGIQYQQGLKDMAPASDLAEGLLNDRDRPPVQDSDGRLLYEGKPIPHFNEVDEGAGVDALITNRVWSAMGIDPTTTLHDIRWGERYQGDGFDEFVWVFEISGAVPPTHLRGGYAGAVSERQPPMYFPLGGGTIKGVSRQGEVVWSRIFIMDGALHADLGRATAVELPDEETQRRWEATTPQWPMMHAVLHGVNQHQMMARHRANHINVAYAPDAATADRALAAKAAMLHELGVKVSLCGDVSFR